MLDSDGPALGLIADADVRRRVAGMLRRGDAILLYTDGLVETPNRDIALGIDQLLGQAERLLRGGFDGGAAAAHRHPRLAQRRPRAAARAPALSTPRLGRRVARVAR